MSDRGESLTVMGVDDEARHLVGLVRNDMLVKERSEGQIGESILRRDLFLACLSRNAGQLVATARRRGLGQECLDVAERITAISDHRAVHRGPRRGGSPHPRARSARPRLVGASREQSNECRPHPCTSATSIFGRFGTIVPIGRLVDPDDASMCCMDTTELRNCGRPLWTTAEGAVKILSSQLLML